MLKSFVIMLSLITLFSNNVRAEVPLTLGDGGACALSIFDDAPGGALPYQAGLACQYGFENKIPLDRIAPNMYLCAAGKVMYSSPGINEGDNLLSTDGPCCGMFVKISNGENSVTCAIVDRLKPSDDSFPYSLYPETKKGKTVRLDISYEAMKKLNAPNFEKDGFTTATYQFVSPPSNYTKIGAYVDPSDPGDKWSYSIIFYNIGSKRLPDTIFWKGNKIPAHKAHRKGGASYELASGSTGDPIPNPVEITRNGVKYSFDRKNNTLK